MNSYPLIHRLWYFYDDEHESDPSAVLNAILTFVDEHDDLDVMNVNVHVGINEEDQPYVEGTIEFVDPSWPIGKPAI